MIDRHDCRRGTGRDTFEIEIPRQRRDSLCRPLGAHAIRPVGQQVGATFVEARHRIAEPVASKLLRSEAFPLRVHFDQLKHLQLVGSDVELLPPRVLGPEQGASQRKFVAEARQRFLRE